MSSPSRLTLSMLSDAVGGGAVAIRAITKLRPASGSTDKVFPPTYVKDKQSVTKYALETRKVDGRDVQTVLLDRSRHRQIASKRCCSKDGGVANCSFR
jgi:hypothetical protein